jgi:LPS export ABC transporter protein LptC
MSWRWATLAALLAALVIGYGAFQERATSPSGAVEPPQQPGYYLQDALITETQPDGSLRLRLSARYIQQSAVDESIAMDQVRVNYFQTPDREWLLTADRGVIPADSRIVQFAGDVQLQPAQEPQTWLRTQALAIDTERNLAYGMNAPAALQLGGHAVNVQNFTAELDTGALRLESVNGRFEAP